MAVAIPETVAFWDLELEDAEQVLTAPRSVQPCIQTSGVTDIGIFPEEQDARVPVDTVDFQTGGKYRCQYFPLLPPPSLLPEFVS